MRIAEAGQVIIRGDSDRATGELIDTETVTISSEEGRWKRAERYLAGGLSYRKHGSEGGQRFLRVRVAYPTRKYADTPSLHGVIDRIADDMRQRLLAGL
jgi:hypothetical protein